MDWTSMDWTGMCLAEEWSARECSKKVREVSAGWKPRRVSVQIRVRVTVRGTRAHVPMPGGRWVWRQKLVPEQRACLRDGVG